MLVGGSQNFTTLLWGDHKIPGVQNGGGSQNSLLEEDRKIDLEKVW